MKIIDEVSSKYNLFEIGHGQREVQFAFIDGKTGKTITPFCRCKDYFNDMFFSNKIGKELSIYGFHWKPNQDEGILDRNTMTVAVRLRDQHTKNIYDLKEEEIQSVRKLMQQVSNKAGLGRIIVRVCEENKNIIVYFNRKWADTPYLNSAFFFFIRLGFTYKNGEDILSWYNKGEKFISPNDQFYFKQGSSRIKDILEGKLDLNQKYEMYTNANIHGASGLIGYKDYKVA